MYYTRNGDTINIAAPQVSQFIHIHVGSYPTSPLQTRATVITPNVRGCIDMHWEEKRAEKHLYMSVKSWYGSLPSLRHCPNSYQTGRKNSPLNLIYHWIQFRGWRRIKSRSCHLRQFYTFGIYQDKIVRATFSRGLRFNGDGAGAFF